MAQRLAVNDLAKSFTPAILEMDEAARVLDVHGQRAMAKEQEEAAKQEQEHCDFAKAFQEQRVKRLEALGKGGKDKAGGKGKAGGRGGEGGEHGAYPKELPSTIPQAEAKRFTPPSSSIWRGLSHCSWNAHLMPYRRISEPWCHGGESAALKRILRRLLLFAQRAAWAAAHNVSYTRHCRGRTVAMHTGAHTHQITCTASTPRL